MNNGIQAAKTALSEIASVILGYVAVYPNGVHGYHLGRMLSRSPLGFPSLRLGQLYRILHNLERLGLVKSQVEVAEPRPARYRFVTTAEGRSAFRQWLTNLPQDSGRLCEQVLNRLRFSDRLPGSELKRLLEVAVRECQSELDKLNRQEMPTCDTEVAIKPLHSMAAEARLAADRRWLDEIRSLVEESCAAADRGAA